MFRNNSFSLLARITATLVAAVSIAGTSLSAQAQTTAPAADASAGASVPAAITPAPAAVPAAKPATKTVESVENPYGLGALWKAGDFVAKFVLVVMVIMSMGSWYIMIVKLWEQAKLGRQAKEAAKSFWSAGTIRQGADTLHETSPFRFIAEAGLDATKKHDGLLGQVDLNTWVTMSIQRSIERVQSRLQDGLAFLATVGSTAPFIGLFGTVWGIYHALTAIGVAGQASIDKVAGPVGEALIMTAIGLAVAVPAVLGYNWLVRRNKSAMEDVRAFGNDLHSVLLAAGNARKA
jgi:biopolymer transport protein ExbB